MKFCVQLMIGFFCFLLFCVEGFSIESEANQEKLSIETFEAVAYSTEDKILYRELHRIQRKNQRIIHSETVYLNPEGEKIAEMISDYSNNIHVPNYRYSDELQDYEDGVECRHKECVIYRIESGSKKEIKEFSIGSDLSRFIRQTGYMMELTHEMIPISFPVFQVSESDIQIPT